MKMRNQTELMYQRASIEGASPIGLMIALFDQLAGDLRRAADAVRENNVERRCKELNHALLVIGQLENWIDTRNGGESAIMLSKFYAYLRAMMMEASVTKSAKLLDSQIEMVLHVRTAWHQLDTNSQRDPTTANDSPWKSSGISVDGDAGEDKERIALSQSA